MRITIILLFISNLCFSQHALTSGGKAMYFDNGGDIYQVGLPVTKDLIEAHAGCEVERDSLLDTEMERYSKLEASNLDEHNQVVELIDFKTYLIERGNCKESKWVYDKPTFEGFMEWKIESLIKE